MKANLFRNLAATTSLLYLRRQKTMRTTRTLGSLAVVFAAALSLIVAGSFTVAAAEPTKEDELELPGPDDSPPDVSSLDEDKVKKPDVSIEDKVKKPDISIAVTCYVSGGTLYCNNVVPTPLYIGSAWQDDVLTSFSWFWCWYRTGGVTWYWTQGDRYGNWGWAHQNYLYTSSAFDANPGAYDMRYCY